MDIITKNVLIAPSGGRRFGEQAWGDDQVWDVRSTSDVLLIRPSLWVSLSVKRSRAWACLLFRVAVMLPFSICKGLKQGPDICSLTSLTYR